MLTVGGVRAPCTVANVTLWRCVVPVDFDVDEAGNEVSTIRADRVGDHKVALVQSLLQRRVSLVEA